MNSVSGCMFFIICSDKLNLKAEWRIVMNELDYGRIGKRIRQVRKAKGWSQDDFAGCRYAGG